MQLKEIFNEFNSRYYNRPIPFEDQISSDGVRDTYALSFNPLCDYEPYLPQVLVNGQKLLPGADYIIDYVNGVITFINVPEAGDRNVQFLGFYQKCNLEEFINHYNTTVRLMQITFPVTKMIRIDWAPIFGVKEDEIITHIDLSLEPLQTVAKALEIYQNPTDTNFIPFSKRGDLLLLTSDHLRRKSNLHGDYGSTVDSSVGGVRFPFYILGELRYVEPVMAPGVLDTPVNFDGYARSQVLLLLGRLMYETWLHKSSPMAVTVLNIQNQMGIKTLLQSLDMQIYSDLRSNFSKLAIPNTDKKIYG